MEASPVTSDSIQMSHLLQKLAGTVVIQTSHITECYTYTLYIIPCLCYHCTIEGSELSHVLV